MIAIGPSIMMKFCAKTTEPFGVKTVVSLNPIIVDGTGMCGCCRVSVGGTTRFTCVDGPDFDGHQVDWDEFLARQKTYIDEEKLPLEASQYQCRIESLERVSRKVMEKLHKIVALILTLLLSVTFLAGCTVKASPDKYEESRSLMDTFFKVAVYSEDKTLARKAIDSAYGRMEETSKVASIYDDRAEAYRLNRDGYLDKPSPDVVQLIRLSIEVGRLTDGAFDITVQPLLDIWKAGLWKETLLSRSSH